MNRRYKFSKVTILTILTILVLSTLMVPVSGATYEGSGTEDDPYEIDTFDDLQSAPSFDADAHYVIVQNLTASNYDNENVVEFNGVINGQGYSVTYQIDAPGNAAFSADAKVGAILDNNGTIKNIKFTNVDVRTGSFSGAYAGIVAAQNSGVIKNIHISNSDSIGEQAGGVAAVHNDAGDGKVAFKNIYINDTYIEGFAENNGGIGPNGIAKINAADPNAADIVNADVNNITAYSPDGFSLAGGIASARSVSDVTVKRVSVEDSRVEANNAGGILGSARSNSNTTKLNKAYSRNVTVDAYKYGGGIIGVVGDTNISNFWSSADAYGSTAGGTLFGRVEDTTAGGDRYCNQDISSNCVGQDDTSGVDFTKLTTSEMQGSSAETNMDGLDFGDTWKTQSNDYPELQGQPLTFAYKNETVNKQAYPITNVDVARPSEDIDFYSIVNSEVSPTDDVTWSFGDGTSTTTNASSRFDKSYPSAGKYTVSLSVDGNIHTTEVIVHESPITDLVIDPNPALEGEDVNLDGSGSTTGVVAARPDPAQLSVTADLRTWLPLSDTDRVRTEGANYTGTRQIGSNSWNSTAGFTKDGSAVVYGTSGELYVDTAINYTEPWTITQQVSAENTTWDNHTLFVNDGGEGVGVKNGNLVRLTDENTSEVVTNLSNQSYNLTVQHDGAGTFQYYLNDVFIGADTGYNITQTEYILIDSDDGYYNQTKATIYDDWRAYQRILTDNEVYSINDYDKLTVPNKSALSYRILLDSTLLSTNSTHTISGGLSVGDYQAELQLENADRLTSSTTKTLQVDDVVPPRIDNLSPNGSLSTRSTTIAADISHPVFDDRDYPVDVQLIRTNEVTGNTETLVDTTINSNQRLTYSADHKNTGVENYEVNRESFSYQWVATEPEQGLSSSETGSYDIPAKPPEWRDLSPTGLQPDRTVNYSARLTDSFSSNVDVELTTYDFRDDSTQTIYTDTVTPPTTVNYKKTYNLQTNSVPSDYRRANLFTYRWNAKSSLGNVTSTTKEVEIPSILYVVSSGGNIIGNQTTVTNSTASTTSTNGVHNISDVVNTQSDDYEGEVSSSGYIDAPLYITEFSRGHSVLLYETNQSDIFNKSFNLDGLKAVSQFDLDRSYLTFSTKINGTVYQVSQNPIDQNGDVSAVLEDGTTYQLAIRDEDDRRTLGDYTADKSEQDQTENLSVTQVSFDADTGYEVSIKSEKYNDTTGYIDYQFSSNNDNISSLDVRVIRENDSKILYSDSQAGRVDTYSATYNITNINQSYVVEWSAYSITDKQEVSGSQVIRIGFNQLLDDLPQSMLTTLAGFILILILGVSGQISNPWSLGIVVVFAGLFAIIGWLPITMITVTQAGLLAVLYYIARDDINT